MSLFEYSFSLLLPVLNTPSTKPHKPQLLASLLGTKNPLEAPSFFQNKEHKGGHPAGL